MSLKTIIFFGLLAVALGFTLPEEEAPIDSAFVQEWADADVVPIADDLLLVRRARSLQRRVEGRYEQDRYGKRANVDYTHRVNKNLDVYGSARRDFSRNDNSGHVGLRYKF